MDQIGSKNFFQNIFIFVTPNVLNIISGKNFFCKILVKQQQQQLKNNKKTRILSKKTTKQNKKFQSTHPHTHTLKNNRYFHQSFIGTTMMMMIMTLVIIILVCLQCFFLLFFVVFFPSRFFIRPFSLWFPSTTLELGLVLFFFSFYPHFSSMFIFWMINYLFAYYDRHVFFLFPLFFRHLFTIRCLSVVASG